MISVFEAKQIIIENAAPGDAESCALVDSVGRILATNITAPVSLPLFDNSAMDGYAVICADTQRTSATSPVKLRISWVQAAGVKVAAPVKSGSCVRIMTGAPLPDGADTVVIQENVKVDDGWIVLTQPVERGDNVRFAGEEIRRGDVVLRAGQKVTSAVVGLAASLGLTQLPLIQQPRVGIVATGNELMPQGSVLKCGQIYESNSHALKAALAESGLSGKVTTVAGDDLEQLHAAFAAALEACTHLLVTGGVSVGDLDNTRVVFRDLGVQEVFWKVKQKPGKPLYFGKRGHQLIFGLPGNPVSALICYHEYVLPALQKYQGMNPQGLAVRQMNLAHDVKKKAGLTHFLRGAIGKNAAGELQVTVLGGQNSHMMLSFSQAHGLIVLPEEVSEMRAGERVEVHVLPGYEGTT